MRPGSFRTDADFGLAGAFHLPALGDAAEIEADAAPLAVGCGSGLVGCDGHRGWRAVSDFPDGRYDVDLNSYFLLNPAPENTQAAIAYDLASFPTFLWCNREPLGTRSLRDARPEDRDAYHRWRRIDERGPGVRVRPGAVKSPRSIRFISGRSLPDWLSRIRFRNADSTPGSVRRCPRVLWLPIIAFPIPVHHRRGRPGVRSSRSTRGGGRGRGA